MSLSSGRDLFMTPGPSVMPDAVLNAMHRAAPNIYEGELIETTDSIIADLKTIAGTTGQAAIYVSNGHGVWEATISNVLQPGDKVLVPATGRFAHGWANVASQMGVSPEIIEFGRETPIDADQIESRLREDKLHEIKAVLVTHTDTSTSVRNDILPIRHAIDAANHPALLMVDCVASFGCERFEMDNWGVDIAITASQKGLMTPPGMAYVFFNDKAAKIAQATPKMSPYWDWELRVSGTFFYQKFFGTAPTHLLFAQRAALDIMLAEGMETVWHRHHTFAKTIWAAVEAWGENGPFRLNIQDPAFRSNAVTTVQAQDTNCVPLRDWCTQQAGLTLGLALGFEGDEYGNGNNVFRIGHMGHLNPPMVLGALATIDAGLKALGIPHGGGALQAATKTIVL
ncbi:MAG: aminotransferase class V-fold PLP-dependent enzyme [Rhodobacteraceae bacterium]|nr:aminotransferase class V-fold PLP-dependent enzyme [Paracoccaceae bacterium]